MNPFPLSGAVYLKSPTGARAADLEGLTREVAQASGASLFWHTQMARLHDPFAEELPWDDLSTWVRGALKEPETAERIAYAIQSSPTEIETLRGRLLDVFESLAPKERGRSSAPSGGEFAFLAMRRAEIPTGLVCRSVDELIDHLADAGSDVWFHHLIEEAWMLPGETPLIEWLCVAGAEAMAIRLEADVQRGLTVRRLRTTAQARWRRVGVARRVVVTTDGSAVPTGDDPRSMVARLARRAARRGGPR